jgi:squalene-hopene/tetraprenyl-beta-curcumene cyclase
LYGRWGVVYIYGVFRVVRPRGIKRKRREARILRAGEWLRRSECRWRMGGKLPQPDNRIFTGGPSTPSQTAWAILGLIAGGDPASLSVQHGIEYLLETQRPDGSWDELPATGTGFPRVFYLNYHMYKDYFPLLALSSFVKARAAANG